MGSHEIHVLNLLSHKVTLSNKYYLNFLQSNKKYVSKYGSAKNATDVEETRHEDGQYTCKPSGDKN